MKPLQSNAAGYHSFTTVNSSRVATDADSLPTAILRRNGTSSGVTVTIANLTTGRYSASWTNGAWTTGDHLALDVTAIVGGTTYNLLIPVGWIDSTIAAVEADTQDIQSRLPAALVGGRMDASVGAMQADTLTASALATDAVNEIQSGLATSAGQSTINTTLASIVSTLSTITSRIGAFTGSGVNNVLGFFLALMRKDASTPSDVGGTFSPASDSNEAQAEAIAAIDTGGAGVTGDRSFTVLVTDQDDVPLEGAKVTTRLNADKPAFYTEADGTKDIQRDDGTWQVSIQLWGYDFTAEDLVVNALIEGTTVTYQMTRRVSVSEVPGAVSATFVWTQWGVEQVGQTLYYKMTRVPAGSTGNVFGDGATQTAVSDENAVVTIDPLYPGATYIFWTASSSRTPVKITIAANATDPVDLASLLSS